ncbi:hypothetical protein ACTU44_12150 [Thalassospira sp. SM2505]
MAHNWDQYISIGDAARMNDHCRISCANHLCDHSGTLAFEPLLTKHHPATGLGKILRKLRCTECGLRGAVPIIEAGNKKTPARNLFCAIRTDGYHPCDPYGACKDVCQIGRKP